MIIFKIKQKNFEELVAITVKSIRQGKVIVSPTDTVYGLIADATNKKAVEKIFKIKKRPENKPLPVFIKDLAQVKELVKIDKTQEKFLKSVWPGATTLVFERKKSKIKLYGLDKKTIALRIPKYKLIIEIIKKLKRPLAETSANISGKPTSNKIKEITSQFKNQKYQPDLILDAGDLPRKKPSIVLDLTILPPKILRN